jgi:cell division protein FtsI (penicillin-binding protein 3)
MAKKTGTENRTPSRVLMYFYLLFLFISIIVIIKIYRIQNSWEPNPKFAWEFRPHKNAIDILPREGSIMDHNGHILAISTPLYNIYMDCYVQKEYYDSDIKNGKAKNDEWLRKADKLSGELAAMFPELGKDSTYYSNLIRSSRANKKRYVSILNTKDSNGKEKPLGVGHKTVEKLKTLPLLNEPSHKGGLRVDPIQNRMYPYEHLAKRTIGYVNPNDGGTFVGIEGAYYRKIKGTAGTKWVKQTDQYAWISDIDSTSVEAVDGLDVRTTLDINIQDIADRAMRNHLDTVKHINSACAVVMDVKTGAVRAMVNLQRNKKGKLDETLNIAVGRASEPGSIYKTIILTALLEDGNTTLETKLPIDKDEMRYPGIGEKIDRAVFNYGKRHDTNFIPVIDGLAISSNHVFMRLATDYYYKNHDELLTRLHSYNLGGSFSFEIEENCGTSPSIPDPTSGLWSGSTIPTMAYGYGVKVTPLQILTFYNAIANDGKMMKPYIVESFEKNGKIVEKREPALQTIVCSEAISDTLKRALKQVTKYKEGVWAQDGTAAKSMRGSKCVVAGKTGTAWIYLEGNDAKGSKDGYHSASGATKYQASFVGFFPADDPKYSMIVTTYSDLTSKSEGEGGGGRPTRIARDVVNEIWTYDPQWQRTITAIKENW